MNPFHEGQAVKWKWGTGYGHGKVKTAFTHKVTRKIGGEEITRHGSEDNPAYYVEVEDSNNVLKLHSELQKDS
ncbi:hypervirulence associated TUDOR domain-containing protein [Candidatus Laterigemmans baculatus]|uniref:DUF2945 domain-containing protein n=1 Tax=Candidatus Laterigemmans baculatus TaxID=2770505 RepID=UPI0013D8FCAF|nr:DUF2945 domain-containing protein [Candidatus Laterigemmans baculatus]